MNAQEISIMQEKKSREGKDVSYIKFIKRNKNLKDPVKEYLKYLINL